MRRSAKTGLAPAVTPLAKIKGSKETGKTRVPDSTRRGVLGLFQRR